jgi:hypothetical protein
MVLIAAKWIEGRYSGELPGKLRLKCDLSLIKNKATFFL